MDKGKASHSKSNNKKDLQSFHLDTQNEDGDIDNLMKSRKENT
jgi:hypothetical protein